MKNLKKDNKGFTLVELIVVIAILGVLMAVLVPQYIQYVEKSREGADLNALGEIFHAAEINAASSETAPAQLTITIGDNGVISIPPDLQSTLGKTVTLKSSDGIDYKGTYYIGFDSDGKAFWTTTDKAKSDSDTKTQFTKLTNGKKGS